MAVLQKVAQVKEPYVVTDKGGMRPDVGGRVRMVGETVMLTADQAKWELSRGIVITAEEDAKRAAAAEQLEPDAKQD